MASRHKAVTWERKRFGPGTDKVEMVSKCKDPEKEKRHDDKPNSEAEKDNQNETQYERWDRTCPVRRFASSCLCFPFPSSSSFIFSGFRPCRLVDHRLFTRRLHLFCLHLFLRLGLHLFSFRKCHRRHSASSFVSFSPFPALPCDQDGGILFRSGADILLLTT